ncbi:BTB/POZ domain-containing protein [Capsicum annuum]|nr:BTB/POZ domain-containing protein [Capsicum annuum]
MKQKLHTNSENKVVDALSRVTGAELLALITSPTTTDLFDAIVESWHTDPELKKLIADLQEATLKRFLTLFYWTNMRTELKEFIQRSDVCQKNQSDLAAYPGLLKPLPIPETEQVWPFPSPETSLYSSICSWVFLDNVVKLHGLPDAITGDRDVVFLSSFWQELFGLQGVLVHTSKGYHPQSDGQTEVLNRCLETYLRCYFSDDASNWFTRLPTAEYWYNTCFHSAIQTTPDEALYGMAPPLHLPYLPGSESVLQRRMVKKGNKAVAQVLVKWIDLPADATTWKLVNVLKARFHLLILKDKDLVLGRKETAVMDLLKFIYSNALSATTPTGVFDVLMAADKFEVVSCMRYCSFLLQNLHMTTDSALLYLNLPSNILMADDVQLLTNAAKKFLAARFVDITKFQEEVFSLPLLGIEAVLSSDDLQIDSEDAVYDIALKWARKHYPKLEERWEVWSSNLCHLIRFPFMTERKLRKVLMCSDFDPELASKLVIEALFYKDEAPYCQGSIAAEAGNALHHCYVQRAYKYRPVKALHFETPRQQCIIYLDLKRDECVRLFPVGRVYTQTFHLGGRGFFLSARCSMDQQNGSHCFGLFLRMQEKGSESFAVDYEFAARISPDEKYVRKHKGDYIFTRGMKVGCRNLFGVDWTTFLDRDSVYFINGILYLRAEVTVRQ